VGVAPGTPLFAIRVLDAKGNGDFAGVMRGLEWVQKYNAKVANESGKIRVVNLSLGGDSYSVTDALRLRDDCKGGTSLHKAFCLFTRDRVNGAVVVVAANNENQDLEHTVPAAFPEVLAVTAMAGERH
jgi:subtilisin family serine protease